MFSDTRRLHKEACLFCRARVRRAVEGEIEDVLLDIQFTVETIQGENHPPHGSLYEVKGMVGIFCTHVVVTRFLFHTPPIDERGALMTSSP